MSGVAIVTHLLTSNAPLLAQVPAAQICGGIIPQGTPLTAIAVTQVSGSVRKTVRMGESPTLWTERIQATVVAASYEALQAVLQLVLAACPVSRGTVNGFACDSVLPDVTGPDMYRHEDGAYIKTQDFIVKFNR